MNTGPIPKLGSGFFLKPSLLPMTTIVLHPSLKTVLLSVTLFSSPLFLTAAETIAPILFADNFTHSLEQWSAEQMPGGRIAVEQGSLVIEDAGGTTLWFRSRLHAPIEINYEVEVVVRGGAHDRLSDLNCFWMAQDPTQPDGALPTGRSGRFKDYDNLLTYYVGYGGNNNTTTRFRRYDGTSERPLLPAHDLRSPHFLLKANHVYQIKLVARGELVEFWRDGEKIFSHHDPQPLSSGYFGFRTVRSHLVIKNFTIHHP